MKLLMVSLLLISQAPVPVNQSFGHGVIIRTDGNVMIDGWTQYDPSPTPTPKKYPSAITIGKTVPDTANICFEYENGTTCQNVGKLRGLAKK